MPKGKSTQKTLLFDTSKVKIMPVVYDSRQNPFPPIFGITDADERLSTTTLTFAYLKIPTNTFKHIFYNARLQNLSVDTRQFTSLIYLHGIISYCRLIRIVIIIILNNQW